MPANDFVATLRALRDGGVEFVVVGGVAAVLNGAPANTFDLDIVPASDEKNIENLLRVRDNCGPVDVLGTIGHAMDYEDLLPHSVEMDLGEGVRVHVLDLATIVALKEELGQEKDLAVLPLLRRTLQLKRE